jgi:DNA-binding protein HU-beta
MPRTRVKEVLSLNKSELISKVAEAAGLTKKVAGEAIEATLEAITNALVNGEKVTLVGFGTFEVRDRAAKRGVNPVTKEPIDIPASKNPAFKAGKQLKEAVSKK